MKKVESPRDIAEAQLSKLRIDTLTINDKHYVPIVLFSMIPECCAKVYSDVRNETITKYLARMLRGAIEKIDIKTWISIACSEVVLKKLRDNKNLKKEDFGSISTIFTNYGIDKLSIIYLISFSAYSASDKEVVYSNENIVALKTKRKQLEKVVENAIMDFALLKKIFVSLSE